MAKVMRPVYQCDMKGCQFISLKEEEMTNVEFVAYDDEKGKFYMRKMLLCKEHIKDYQRLSGEKTEPKTEVKKQESKKNVKKDLKKEEKRDNIYTNRTDVREERNDTITLSSEYDMQPYSSFYNVHEFYLSKNGKQLPGKYQITIAPLKVENTVNGIEIAALVEKGDEKEALSSTLEERKTVQYIDEINQISITCRGFWENGLFRSKIYIASMEGRSVRVDKVDEKIKSYHPEEYNEAYYQSHYQISTENDRLKLYLIPIMQKNYLNQCTKLLVVIETEYQRNALTDEDGIVTFSHNEKRYRISGSWQNKEFYGDISQI